MVNKKYIYIFIFIILILYTCKIHKSNKKLINSSLNIEKIQIIDSSKIIKYEFKNNKTYNDSLLKYYIKLYEDSFKGVINSDTIF